jgi:ferredoxin
MATNPKWVLSCKNCHAECVYAAIPSDTENYFMPKKPQIPANFTHKCEGCGHVDSYERTDLIYRDETMPSRAEAKKCGEAEPMSRGATAGSAGSDD